MFLSTIALTVALAAPIAPAPAQCTGDELCNAPGIEATAWELFEDRGYADNFQRDTAIDFVGYYDGSAVLTATEFPITDDSGRQYIFDIVSVNPLFTPIEA